MLRNFLTSLTIAAFVLTFAPVFIGKAYAQDETSSFVLDEMAMAIIEDIAVVDEAPIFEEEMIFGEAEIIANYELEEIRGTALSPEVLGVGILDGISANNVSNGTVSGGNIIDANAFSASSGLSTIIQNSGNNVVIQSATILNVVID
jgi:hypothetical protein